MLSFTAHENHHHLCHGQLNSIFYSRHLHIWNPPIQSQKSCRGEISFLFLTRGDQGSSQFKKITAVVFQLAERVHRSQHTVAPNDFWYTQFQCFYSRHVVQSLSESISAAIESQNRNGPGCFPSFLHRPAIHSDCVACIPLEPALCMCLPSTSLFSYSVVLILDTFLMMDLVRLAKDTASIRPPCLSLPQTAVRQKEEAAELAAAQHRQTEQSCRIQEPGGNKGS